MEVLVAIFGLLTVLGIFRFALRTVHSAGRCQHQDCGYDLTALSPVGICPECGRTYDLTRIDPRQRFTIAVGRDYLLCMGLVWLQAATFLLLSSLVARVFLAVDYWGDGFSWETSWFAPQSRELRRHGILVLLIWPILVSLTPMIVWLKAWHDRGWALVILHLAGVWWILAPLIIGLIPRVFGLPPFDRTL